MEKKKNHALPNLTRTSPRARRRRRARTERMPTDKRRRDSAKQNRYHRTAYRAIQEPAVTKFNFSGRFYFVDRAQGNTVGSRTNGQTVTLLYDDDDPRFSRKRRRRRTHTPSVPVGCFDNRAPRASELRRVPGRRVAPVPSTRYRRRE